MSPSQIRFILCRASVFDPNLGYPKDVFTDRDLLAHCCDTRDWHHVLLVLLILGVFGCQLHQHNGGHGRVGCLAYHVVPADISLLMFHNKPRKGKKVRLLEVSFCSVLLVQLVRARIVEKPMTSQPGKSAIREVLGRMFLGIARPKPAAPPGMVRKFVFVLCTGK
ncbi:uncharacterized protein PG998_008723 [Apiospora kogelbergensis]|uniref:uncharacterized protein n=1 Tax=Apiospora kogelbergensis TaxID=1337665 RepID=UPI00313206B5